MTEAIFVSSVCIAVIAANVVIVFYRWTPKVLSPVLQLACITPLLFACGNLAANMATGAAYEAALAMLYTGLFGAVLSWWLVTTRILAHQGSPIQAPKWLWRDTPAALIAFFWLAALTNPWHGAFLTPNPGARSGYQLLWYGGALTCWGLIIATVLIGLQRAFRADYHEDRLQLLICAVAMLIPTFLNLLYTVSSNPPTYDPTIIGFAISTSMFVFAAYRGQLYAATGVRLEDAVDADPRPGFLLDLNGRLIFANAAAKAFMRLPKERIVLAPLLAQHLVDKAGREVGERALDDETLIFQVRDKPEQWMSIEQRQVRIRSRDVGAAWFLRDETGRVQVDEALQAARQFESLGLIAGGVAHDFNNLLVAVMGNAELAQLEVRRNPERAAELMARVVTASQQGADLARQLLTYAGKSDAERAPLDINHLLAELLDVLRPSTPSTIRMQLTLPESPSTVLGDKSQVSQIVLNLLVNAEEAMASSGGTITLSAHQVQLHRQDLQRLHFHEAATPGVYIQIRVQDEGPGMDAQTIRRMFDPFFSTKFVGRGLGLAAALGTVRSHQGALDVKSSEGAGTTIDVYLPHAKLTAAGPYLAAERLPERWSQLTALVVDDNPEVRRVHALMLRQIGFDQIIKCEDGPSAIEQADAADLALVDLTMPGMSGADTAAALHRVNPDITILIVSGFSEGKLPEQTPHRFLAKPFNVDALEAAIRTAFAERRTAPEGAVVERRNR